MKEKSGYTKSLKNLVNKKYDKNKKMPLFIQLMHTSFDVK